MQNKRVAILFFGLTRTLHKTIHSLKEYLFKPLDEHSVHYDIFMHTYKIFGRYHNMWSNEYTEDYPNEDVEALLHPKYLLVDNQETIINRIDFNEYYKKLGNWDGTRTEELTRYLIRNMCLALYSKKQITLLFDEHKDEYDYAIIIRPDALLQSRINVGEFINLHDGNIIMPEIHWYHGCNDRLCIGTPNIISYCGKLFDHLQPYSEQKSIVSEIFFLDKLNERSIHIIKTPIQYENIRMHQ